MPEMNPQIIGIIFFVALIGVIAFAASEVYRQVRPGKLRVRMISKTRVEMSFFTSIHQTFFVHEKKRYTIDPHRIYHTGFFRMPVAVYQENLRNPLDLLAESQTVPPTDITAQAAYDALETHVAREVLESFRDPFLTPEVTLGITAIILLIGFGAIYYFMTEGFDKLVMMH